MRHLRLALGYRTEHRSEDAAVLASGFDQGALQAAIDGAPAEFVRFEFGVFHFQRKAARARNSTPPSPAVPGENPGTAAPAEQAPPAPPAEETPQAVDAEPPAVGADDAPSIGEPPPSRRRR